MKNKIFKQAESALKKNGIHYAVEDEKAFTFGIKGDDCNFDVVLLCDEEKGLLTTLVACSFVVPSVKLDKMCRWIAERNLEIVCGCFQLDTSDGKLYFRLTCPVIANTVDEKFVESIFTTAVSTFNFFYDDMVKALYFENIVEDEPDMVMSEIQDELESGKEHRIYS